ncbi:MAG: type II secretion system protein [Cyanobacteria bacterium SIG30]|nr:type II secretion system protein [Cyanobacteria bacterium SIG30]
MKKINFNLGGGATNRLKAFTLAEVLITLAIIGVVAALTIPAVVANYKKTEIETQLKSTYSILSNALNLAIKDYGPAYTWSIERQGSSNKNAELFLKQYFVPYLKVARDCGTSNEGECKHQIYALGGGKFNYGYGGNPSENFAKIYLANGTYIGSNVSSEGDKFVQLQFFIDANGHKKPNQVGVDIHFLALNLSPPTKTTSKRGYRFSVVGGNTIAESIKYSSYGCQKPSTSADGGFGVYCASVLFANGWKIPSVDEYVQMAGGDENYRAKYPWNF